MTNTASSAASTMLFLLLRTAGIAIAFLATIRSSQAAPMSDLSAMMYLSKYGYMNQPNTRGGAIISQEAVSRAITEFQAFAGLNVTGELDKDTITLMETPRCGVKDVVGFGNGARSKRYALQGSRWRTKALTYRISKYPRKLGKAEVDDEVKKAFDVWAEYTDLTFTAKSSGSVHIEIRFETGEHGDGDPFDGRGGTLAHAYFPVYGGDAHFDDDEQWTIGQYRGTNLFQVAAHEFGHSLGLSHSDIKAALMAPFYRGYEPAFTLHTDDIEGIQALYGKKSRTSPSSTSTSTSRPAKKPATTENKELCLDSSVDTMFNSAEGVTYAFKGDMYYKLNDEGVEPGYPKRISQSWVGLPGNIDAAFTYKNGKTYFFKGSQYWRYVGKTMDGDYPKLISDGFTGIPDNLDASVVWTGNGKIYFYKGSKFWKFDPTQKPPVKSTYPKPISNWEGIPDNLDAALVYRGYTYFFKGTKYYRFDDRSFTVDAGNPPFPRPTGRWWFGCKESRLFDNANKDAAKDADSGVRGMFSNHQGLLLVALSVLVALLKS
ncbi:matrix metalloproteinase-14 isoform X2 [Anabrus simplex]|uniref:matrix metalloproteinase-14 isoform X2 n=1 Tax=Anabrus simplex TaxID=316456 RepID=UPI0035A2EADF